MVGGKMLTALQELTITLVKQGAHTLNERLKIKNCKYGKRYSNRRKVQEKVFRLR